MLKTILFASAALAACGGNSGGGECGGGVTFGGGGGGGRTGNGGGNSCTGTDAPTGGGSVHFEAFSPKTRSVGDAIGSYQLAISDGTGGTACGLSSDKANTLGTQGHEILATLTSSGASCQVGTYSFGSDCPADPGAEPAVPYHCAYYRPFDSTGKSMGFVAATAGSVTISGDYTACTFTVNLSFAGTQFNDTFTLYNGTGTMPWCTP
jgi:hypothetical protein